MEKRARIHPQDTPAPAGQPHEKLAEVRPLLDKQALERLDRDPVRKLVDRATESLRQSCGVPAKLLQDR